MRSVLLLRSDADLTALKQTLQGLGGWATLHVQAGGPRKSITLEAHSRPIDTQTLRALPGVEAVFEEQSPHPLLDKQRGRGVRLANGLMIGGGSPPVLAAGPCAAETEAQVDLSAEVAAQCGARLLRAGAFKPRSSPHAFSGNGMEALTYMRRAADRHGLALVSEILSEADVEALAPKLDLIQIGTRNMQNFALLKAIGATGQPALLKRGRSATLLEWRLAAEHLLAAGASGVVFCERGVLGFDPETRNMLDLAAAALMRHTYDLTVMVDPSHATGRRDLVLPMARAAMAAGLDGLLIESHPDASTSLSDGPQALTRAELLTLAPMFTKAG